MTKTKRPKRYKKFPLQFAKNQQTGSIFAVSEIVPLETVRRDYVEWVIRRLGGDKPAAADRLGISLRTIYNIFGEDREGATAKAKLSPNPA